MQVRILQVGSRCNQWKIKYVPIMVLLIQLILKHDSKSFQIRPTVTSAACPTVTTWSTSAQRSHRPRPTTFRCPSMTWWTATPYRPRTREVEESSEKSSFKIKLLRDILRRGRPIGKSYYFEEQPDEWINEWTYEKERNLGPKFQDENLKSLVDNIWPKLNIYRESRFYTMAFYAVDWPVRED